MNLVDSEDFPKRYKIRNTNLFNNLFNTGRRTRLKYVTIIIARNNLCYPRLGISITKKSMPKAVERNKLKRIFREFFRKNKELIGSSDLLIICSQFDIDIFGSYKAEDIQDHFSKDYEHKI